MPDPTIENDRCQIILYATKHQSDTYLKTRHRQTFTESQQNYVDESRLNQMILSTDFLSTKSPSEAKRRRNQKRNRSRRQRSAARERRINSLREINRRKGATDHATNNE